LGIKINEEHSFPIIFCKAWCGFHGGRALSDASFEIDETMNRATFVSIKKQAHRFFHYQLAPSSRWRRYEGLFRFFFFDAVVDRWEGDSGANGSGTTSFRRLKRKRRLGGCFSARRQRYRRREAEVVET
jgi:hypothetical protein